MALEKVGTFVLTDESLDADSERVLIDGVDLTRFEGNPVMLYNHIRSASSWYGNTPDNRAILPIGRWENIRKQRKRIVADAYIDFNDEFAAKIGNKVRDSVINAVSIGFRPLAWSDSPEDMEKGQKGLTITQSELWEASLVDVPSNPNALALSITKSVSRPENEQKEANPNGIYIKTFYKLNDNEMTGNNNWFEKAKAFLSKLGKTVQTEEEAIKAFDETELPAAQPDIASIKALVNETIEDVVKKATDVVSANAEKQIKALTEQVANLVEIIQDNQKETEAQAEIETENEKAIKALEMQLANLKAVRKSDTPKGDAVPLVAANTKNGEVKEGEGGYTVVDGMRVKVASAGDVLAIYNNATSNKN